MAKEAFSAYPRLPRPIPWISHQEWLFVFENLFSGDLYTQSLGVKRVRAWQTKGKVPHSIESTADFVEASLLDHGWPNVVPERMLRLQYSLAIIRFVNGLVDSAQKGAFAASVTGLADQLGIPTWIVELRHAATHDKLPTLNVLRSAKHQALNWLLNSYWQSHIRLMKEGEMFVFRCLDEFMRAFTQALGEGIDPESQIALGQKLLKPIIDLSRDSFPETLIPTLLEDPFLPGCFPMNGEPSVSHILVLAIEQFEFNWPGFVAELTLNILEKMTYMVSLSPSTEEEEETLEVMKKRLLSWTRYLMKRFVFVSTNEGSIPIDPHIQACLSLPPSMALYLLQDKGEMLSESQNLLLKCCKVCMTHEDNLNNNDHLMVIGDDETSVVQVDEKMLENQLKVCRQRLEELRKVMHSTTDTDTDIIDEKKEKESGDTHQGWKRVDATEWKPSPIGLLPDGSIPSLNLPLEWDDPAVAEQMGIISVPLFGEIPTVPNDCVDEESEVESLPSQAQISTEQEIMSRVVIF